jgi:L-2-hydroxyglutarate oxidase
MSESADVAVIGGGILGLATAYTIQKKNPGSNVVVVEREAEIAQHQTGHNSGVIHAGVYYKPGSFKAKLCRAGAEEMIAFCNEQGVPYSQKGKLIVALHDDELGRLAELEERANANKVPNLTRLSNDALLEIEPAVQGVAALYSPSTGVTNFAHVARIVRKCIEDDGGKVFTSFDTVEIREEINGEIVVADDGRSVRAKSVVVCSGLHSDRLFKLRTGRSGDIRIIPFRGSYYDLAPSSAALINSMIYPVPDPRFPFLGVHFTRHIDDTVSVGPNAVWALARDEYRRYALRFGDVIENLRFGGFWRMAKKYWRTGIEEVGDDLFTKRYVAKAREYVPEINPHDFHSGGMGIRAQAVSSDGRLLDDFVFQRDGNVLFVMNAPSPAATASFAIGRHIVETLFG